MSIGKAPSSAMRPSASGIAYQSSTYGQTIPVIFGTVRTQLYLIWAKNFREASSSSTKKLKSVSAVFGVPVL